MRDSNNPPRLRLADDASPELLEALKLARADLPPREALDEIAASLGLALPAEGGPAAASRRRRGSVRPVAVGATISFKLLLAAVVAATGLGTAVWSFVRTPEDSAGTAPIAVLKPSSPPSSSGRTEQTTVEEPALDPPTGAPPAAEKSGDNALGRRRHGASTNVDVRATEPQPVSSGGRVEPVGAAEFPDATSAMETSLLGRAERSLASDPAAALRLTEEHRQRFPGGVLSQEREFIAIRALLGVGRRPDALTRAAAFRSRFPGSAHHRRLDLLLGKLPDVEP